MVSPNRLVGVVALLLVAAGVASCGSSDSGAAPSAEPNTFCEDGSQARKLGCQYLVTFYPRWFSHNQLKLVPENFLLGPAMVDPTFEKVVAVNVDTLYATSQVNVKDEPVVVSVPPTSVVFSVLHLDQFGETFAGIPSGAPGAYALTSAGWQGTLPSGVTQVPLPYDLSIVIFRADRFGVGGTDTQAAAAQFRSELRLARLSKYTTDPTAGATTLVGPGSFATSFKVMADTAIATDPTQFLADLQDAVRASTTQPLSPRERAIADAFDAQGASPELVAGAVAGYEALLANYRAHALAGSKWIYFDNIARCDDTPRGALDRASITEYLQYGNAREASVYYHTFHDGAGAALDGSAGRYDLHFAAHQLPEVGRFWSLTAYTPDTVELVPNSANKYAVASYTPALVTGADGSITITMADALPAGVPEANWLPVPRGPFNVVLRAYEPKGAALDGRYVPPGVARALQ